MAQMFPDRPLGTSTSNAERKVFHALKDLLPNDYTVLHHVCTYEKRNHSGRLHDGELDFLIVHPTKGMIVIEVKGGGISRDDVTGQWTSTDADGVIHKIKNPYEQGKEYAYSISKLLQQEKTTRNYDYPFFHAVWFPDIVTTGINFGISPHLHELTLGKQDLQLAGSVIPRLFKNCLGGGRDVPDQEGVLALRKYLAPALNLCIKLSATLNDERDVLLEATKSQYKVLSLLQRHKKALICGSAGSGKTFLAIEKALRLAKDENKRVLFLCYNVKLANKIKETVASEQLIVANHFHGFCSQTIKNARMPLPDIQQLKDNTYLFNNEIPNMMLEALCASEDRYDAVIVDEGQDFDPSWWPVLDICFNDPTNGIFYIFYDDNQGIYRKRSSYPIEGEPFVLEENCRNTRSISDLVNKFYVSDHLPQATGPIGRPPEFIKNTSKEDLLNVLGDVIKRLTKDDHVPVNDIVILSPLSENRSAVKSGMSVGGVKLNWNKNLLDEREIACSTIHSFKGLESLVAIVCELSSAPKENLNALTYIAYSRANSHLIVIE